MDTITKFIQKCLRLQTRIIDTPEGTKKRKTEIIAEKVTFLGSNANKRNNDSEKQKENTDKAD